MEAQLPSVPFHTGARPEPEPASERHLVSLLYVSQAGRPCTYRCRLSRHFAVLIPAEFAGKESCEQSWDAPGMQDLSRSLPPRQVHGELLPPGPADAEQLPQLYRHCRSA